MHLTYRGVSYVSSHSPVPTVATDFTARFRGQTYIRRSPLVLPLQSKPHRVYRGVAY